MKGAGAAGLRRIGSTLRPAFEGRPWLDPLALGALAFVGAAAVGLITGLPVASVHDEFAYLLMGETFANGHLTNPTPPFWEHLETFHVLMVPTYMGKYPPAQGIALAVGFLLGHPILGVWLSSAAMVAAVTWMLQAWLPRGWAAAGGVLVILQLGLASYWTQSYWGGAVAAIGGALVYGAARRLWERPRVTQGVLLGVGLLTLANSRPMEGLVASLPVAVVLVVKLVRASGWGDRLRLTVPTAFVLVAGFALMGMYNRAVTGSATVMPYEEYAEQYQTGPNLLFLEPRTDPPEYRHPEFRQFWVDWDISRYDRMTTVGGFVTTRAKKLGWQLANLLGPAALGLLFVAGWKSRRWAVVAALGAGLTIAASLLTKGAHPHYVAPITAPLVFLAMTGWRRVSEMRPPRFDGMLVLSVAVAVCVITAFGRILVLVEPDPRIAWQQRRSEVARCLASLTVPSLVLVDYRGTFLHDAAWVRNGPRPFESKIVWARSMPPDGDEDITGAIPERVVWRVRIEPSAEKEYLPSGEDGLELVRPPVGSSGSPWEGGPPCR